MPALYSHTTRATGTTLTAAIYNADHQNHITNGIPTMLDDYSSNATEMQATADPGESGSESLATSLAGEIERLRFAILEMKRLFDSSLSYWYQTPNPNDSSGRAPFPPYHIEGLDIATRTTSPAYVEVGTGSCRDSTDTVNLIVTAARHRTVTAQWVSAATGGGRGPAATNGNKQPIHVFVFKTQASGVDIGFDTVLTASNLQARASMTYFRRIGTVFTGTLGDSVINGDQRDGHVIYHGGGAGGPVLNTTFVVTWQGVTVWTPVKIPLIPTGFPVKADILVGVNTPPATGIFTRIQHYGATANFSGVALPHVYAAASNAIQAGAHRGEYWTGPCADVMFLSNSATAGNLVRIRALGYYDRRRA